MQQNHFDKISHPKKLEVYTEHSGTAGALLAFMLNAILEFKTRTILES